MSKGYGWRVICRADRSQILRSFLKLARTDEIVMQLAHIRQAIGTLNYSESEFAEPVFLPPSTDLASEAPEEGFRQS